MTGLLNKLMVLAATAGLCLATGCTSLHKAAGNSDQVVAEQFLQKGVDINAPDDYGRTALMLACGDLDMVRYLVDRGAQVNAQDANGETALMKAAYVGRLDVVQYLVDQGADVNARSQNGWTPLMWGAAYLDVVQYLVGEGADIHAKNVQGGTSLQLAMFYGKSDVVDYLRGHGAKGRRILASRWPSMGKGSLSANGSGRGAQATLAANR